MKKFRKPLLIGLIVAIFVSILYMWGILDGLENKSYDFRFQLRGEENASVNEKLSEELEDEKGNFSDNVVIVEIDEGSVDEFGRWPWPRNYHSRLIDVLVRCGVKLIVFDILFIEHDKNNPFFDIELSRATSKYADKIVYANFIIDEMESVVEGGRHVLKTVSTLKNPYPELDIALMHKGLVNAEPDSDGVLRRARLQRELRGFMHYSIDLVVAAIFKGVTPKELLNGIPNNYKVLLPINFRGGENLNVERTGRFRFKTYPFNQLLNSSIPDMFKKFWVKDKIVLVGSTTLGAYDHYPTPFSENYPGVVFHADVIDNLIAGDYIRAIPLKVTIIIILCLALFCAFLLPVTQGIIGSILVAIVVMMYSFLTYYLFKEYQYAIDYVAPMLGLVLTYMAVLLYRFMSEEKEKRWIKKTFGTYVSPAVIDQIMADPNKLRLGGVRTNMSILFSDIRGFTTMSEGLPPEGVVEILNEYLTKMTGVVFETRGTLDKFIGDAVMAFWGAPVPQADHAKRAVKTALMMFRELRLLREKWEKEGKTLMDIGIGINTGDAVVGNMGSTERMDYTIIGDNVNLASRLESLNKQFSSHIIISESTYELVKDLITVESLGNVKVKGKEKEVAIYKVDEYSGLEKFD